MVITAHGRQGDLGADDGLPLYRRLLARLRADIDGGVLRPGDLIPPELEIARRNGISRHTVRQAILELQREGLLIRERGRGTYIARGHAGARGSFYSFVHEMRDRGLEPATRVLRQGTIAADDVTALRLGLTTGSPVVDLELLRTVDGGPYAIEHSVAPLALVPSLLEADLTRRSIYDVMAEDDGVVVTEGHEELRPVVLDRRQSRLLGVPAGSPAFFVDRSAVHAGVTVEWRRVWMRGDLYLARAGGPAPTV